MKLILSSISCVFSFVFFSITNCSALQLSNQTIYWNEVIPGGGPGGNSALTLLNRVNINGGAADTISTNTTSRLTELAFEPSQQKLYWSVGGFVKRSNPDGSNTENVVTSIVSGQQTGMYGLALNQANSKMYWTDTILKTVNVADFNGANRALLFDGNDIRPGQLVLDSVSSRLYFGNHGDGGTPEGPKDKISRINLTGLGFQTVVSGIVQLTGVDIDPIAQKLYWVDLGFNALNDTMIRRANLDGSGVETLLSNLPDVIIDIQVDPSNNALRWTSRDEGLIKMSTLNGGNVQPIFSGLREPHALLIIPEPANVALCLVGAGIVFSGRRVRFDGRSPQSLDVRRQR